MPERLILTPILDEYIKMSDDEIDALKGIRRTQYRYRLKTRIAMAIEELEELIKYQPKTVEIDALMKILQLRLRVAFPEEEVAIRIETKRKRD